MPAVLHRKIRAGEYTGLCEYPDCRYTASVMIDPQGYRFPMFICTECLKIVLEVHEKCKSK